MADLVQVRGLTVDYKLENGSRLFALRNVDLALAQGETVGLLGESGCGKTSLGLSLLGMLPSSARIQANQYTFQGRSLLGLDEKGWSKVRGRELAMILQQPGEALNPVLRVGDQIADVLRWHHGRSKLGARERTLELLDCVGLEPPARFYSAYPHQLSGGQLQRVVIAQVLGCQPSLLVADEPAASLDSVLQVEILSLLRKLCDDFEMGLLLITHNPGILRQTVSRILVFYAGQIVEEGKTEEIFRSPRHPYTIGLLQSLTLEEAGQGTGGRSRFSAIEGAPPDQGQLSQGCLFEPRCGERMAVCRGEEPKIVQVEEGRKVRCFLFDSGGKE